MKKVAVLLDGGFVLYRLYHLLGRVRPTADDVWGFADSCVARALGEELFRIYFYDCPPFERVLTNPISRKQVDFAVTPTSHHRRALHEQLALMDFVAFRAGELAYNGWAIGPRATDDLIRTSRSVADFDLKPDFEQKRVDMKIGLDVAWLATRRIVDRIVLVTGDSDFIPALKFARREGVQVVLVTMGHGVRKELKEHADELRSVLVRRQGIEPRTY